MHVTNAVPGSKSAHFKMNGTYPTPEVAVSTSKEAALETSLALQSAARREGEFSTVYVIIAFTTPDNHGTLIMDTLRDKVDLGFECDIKFASYDLNDPPQEVECV